MRTVVPLLATLGAALFAVAACHRDHSAALRYVSTGEKGERFYVDTSTLRASPSAAERSFTLVAVEPAAKQSFGAAYDRSVTDDRVDCRTRAFTLGNLRGYKGDSVVFEDPGESQVTLHPGSALDSVATFVCTSR